MTARGLILAIDQGTTSTRSILFDHEARPVGSAQRELTSLYPEPAWVEQDPEELWQSVLATAREALANAGAKGGDVAAIGITNQRETTLLWDRATGAPLYNAIIWQDRRTAGECARLKQEGHEPWVQARTGVLLDPYFSATKLAWLLHHVPGARARAEAGKLAFGTVDSFLLWRLTGGRVHATDATNASRTLLYDIHAGRWCPRLMRLFEIPEELLPDVRDSSADYGVTTEALFGAPIRIGGVAGDQQAALVGQGCFASGMAKATYGTGCFMLLNTGQRAIASSNRLLTTIAYRLAGQTSYAVEGSIFTAGAAVNWLRDGLCMITEAAETEALAASVDDNGGVYLVPAFTGLGAPHWRPDARGLIAGLTLSTTAAHLARAALEAVGYQTADLIDAMTSDGAAKPPVLRVDGGMTANDWLCQFLADLLGVPVERSANLEATALGAAFLGGISAGVWRGPEEVSALLPLAQTFAPHLDEQRRVELMAGWRAALGQTKG